MAKSTDPVDEYGFSSTVRRVLLVNSSGTPISSYANYEAKKFSPGASQTNYNVKTSQSMFAIVPAAGVTTIKNNDGAQTMTVKLNLSTNTAFDVPPNSSVTISTFLVTNLFLTTPGGFSGTVEVIMFG